MKKAFLFTCLLFLTVSIAFSSTIISNGYYKLKNVSSSYYLGEDYATASLRMCASATSTTYDCIWKITNNNDGSVLITNVYTQRWICGKMTVAQTLPCSSTTKGEYAYKPELIGEVYRFVFYRWDSSCALYLNQGCHSYNTGADSQWKLEKVTMTDAQANAAAYAKQVDDMNNAYVSWNTKLLQYFTDHSCSELKDKYKAIDDDALRQAMPDLTTDLQDIAIRVKNQWAGDGVEGRTKQFRVQEYKVYSDAYTWASKLGSWSMGDMNNPTGIYANQKEVLYVFVDRDIPSGTQLRIAPNCTNGYISRSTGPQLHKGMNVIMISGDNYMQWIMYTALGTTTPLSSYPNLKIHIEGGHVLGYMNCESENGYSTIAKENEDTINARYKQILADANTLTTADGKKNTLWFTTKGNYGVFLFPLNSCYNGIWGDGKIYKSMLWYDNVLMWIYDLMGINKRTIDGEGDPANESIECVTGGEGFFPTYCNNKAVTILDENDKSPNGGSWHTDYPSVAAVKSSYDYDHNAAMDNWCTAHESGHQNQSRINMASGTEVSNNLYSNVVVYNHGYRLSRGETLETNLNYYLKGTQYAHRGGGMTHRMYYQLYLYYHLAQHRMDFYPELFRLLRANPMNINSGKDSFLKFYKYCCMAAHEDLTEFFRVWGFFVPFNNAYFGDYTSRYLTLTQQEIDNAIAEVRQMAKDSSWRRNDEIILIEDRIQNIKRTDIYSTGSEWKVAMDRAAGSGVGDLGHYTDFLAGSYSKGSYSTYSRSGNTITVTGTGGVGFLVYNGDNEVIGFSNKKTFTLNEGAFSHTGITYKAIDGDGTLTTLTRDMGDAETMLENLKTAISSAEWVINQVDNNDKKVGFYHPTAVSTLKEILAEAKTARDKKQDYLYDVITNRLTDEDNKVRNSNYSRIFFVQGNTYYLNNFGYGSYYLASEDNGNLKLVTDYYKEEWAFDYAGPNQYYLRNVRTGMYFNDISGKPSKANATTTSNAYKVTMTETNKDGKFQINSNDKNYSSAPYLGFYAWPGEDYVYRSSAKGGTYERYPEWYITIAQETSASQAITALSSQVAAAEAAMNKVGYGYKDVTYTYTPKTLRLAKGQFSISTNGYEPKEGSLANLIDGDAGTYFHSSYSVASNPKEQHYLLIDCGSSDMTDLFTFTFRNRPGNSAGKNSPTGITIKGSNDGVSFTDIIALTTADGLPTATGTQSTFTSKVIGTPGVKYRYLKFVVTDTNTDASAGINANDSYKYFSLAEFSINKVKADLVYTAMDGYSDVSKNAIIAVAREVATAKELLSTGTEAQKTAETPILKNCVDRLTAATAAKTPDEEVAELTDDELYKYRAALDDAITDAENAKAAMANTVLDAQIAAAQKVRDDSTGLYTYLNLTEEKEVLTAETRAQLRSATHTKLTECKTMLDSTMESYSYEWLTDTTYTYSFEKKEAYHELDAQAIARLLAAICEAEKILTDAHFNDATTQEVISAYSDLASAFGGLNTSKSNIDKVKTLTAEKYFKYYADGGEERPGYPTYDEYLIMKEVYDADRSADDIVEAWNEYLASPRALPKAGRFYRFKCVAPVSNTANYQYLLSTLVDVTVGGVTTKRLAASTAGNDDNSIFLWTGKDLCGYSTNSTVKTNSKNMLTTNKDANSSNTSISFESEAGTEMLYLKFTGTNNEVRYAYGASSGKVDGGGSAPADFPGYRWYIEPVESMGDVRDYAISVIDDSEKVGWPGYRSKAAANTLRQAVSDASDGDADKILIAFDRMNKFKSSFQYPEDGMMLRLRSAKTGKYVRSGSTTESGNTTYSMGDNLAESVFYYHNGYLLCYSNGIYMACSNTSWNWAEAGDTTGSAISFVTANTSHAFHVKIPTTDESKPSCVLYARDNRCDRGGAASDDAVRAITDLGYTWYVDLVESLPVTIGSTGYATYSAPVEVTVPDGVKAYYAESYDPQNSMLTMRTVDDGIIPANTGVVLKGDGDGTLQITTAGATAIQNNMLEAVVPSTNVQAADGYTVFILGQKNSKLGFYKMNTAGSTVMSGHKAYLQILTDDLQNGCQSSPSAISVSWDGDVTDLQPLLPDADNQHDDTYNVNGQKVNDNSNGVIVRQGQKYILK